MKVFSDNNLPIKSLILGYIFSDIAFIAHLKGDIPESDAYRQKYKTFII